MIATGKPTTYVDPFDRICHGLRFSPATTDPKEAYSVYQNTKTPERLPQKQTRKKLAKNVSERTPSKKNRAAK